MPREAGFETPVDPSQFGPEQIRPRALLALSIRGLAHWFAAHLVPYPRLIAEHRTGFVFTSVKLEYATPVLRFADSDWLGATSRVSVSESAKYLSLDVAIHGRRADEPDRARQVASFHADLRAVSIVEDLALTGAPGTLPDRLLALFEPDEVYRPDRAALARASTPPEGEEILTSPGYDTALCRSHCEVADQWSFIEVMELLTAARERLFLLDGIPEAVGRSAVAHPTHSITAAFHRSMYLFDTCRITTRVLEAPGESRGMVFVYDVTDPTHSASCVTAWERPLAIPSRQ